MAMKNKSNGKSEGFRYRGPSASTVKQRATQSSGSYDNFINSKFPRFKANDGDNNIRLMPLTWDDMDKWGDNWGIEVWVHSYIGPDNSNFLCLQKMK